MTEKLLIKPQRLKNLVRRLIDIYSPVGKEQEVADFLYSYLKRHGLSAARQEVDEDRDNILVLPEDEENISLAFIGHIDTVWAYDYENYDYSEEGGTIYGLGSADMKSNCAAMVEAFVSYKENLNKELPVALALVVGEEEEGDGTQRLMKGYHFPWAIIGEPTDLKPCMKHYGYIEIQLITLGKRVHASLANLGHNAIESMLKLLLKISAYLENNRNEVVYNIRELSSSRRGFVVPDRCEAWLDIHIPPSAPEGEIMMEIEEIIGKERQDNGNLDVTVRFTGIHRGYELPEKGLLIKNLKDIYSKNNMPWEPDVFRSHSDANILWASGVKPVLLGAGQLEQAHTAEESIHFDDVCKMAQIYLDLLLKFNKVNSK